MRILAQACRSVRARLIHISTDYIFGGDSTRSYVETDCPRPLNVYGTSKLLGENLALREYGDATLILRVASLFGVAGASGKGGNIVETILRVAKEKGQLRVVHDITMVFYRDRRSIADYLVACGKCGAPGRLPCRELRPGNMV